MFYQFDCPFHLRVLIILLLLFCEEQAFYAGHAHPDEFLDDMQLLLDELAIFDVLGGGDKRGHSGSPHIDSNALVSHSLPEDQEDLKQVHFDGLGVTADDGKHSSYDVLPV